MPNRIATLLCALAAHAASPGPDLAFAPAQGLHLKRTFVYSSEGVLEDFSVEVDGEDISAMLGELSVEVESVQTYVVSDEFVAVEDGRIRVLRRRFDELKGESDMRMDAALVSESGDATASSELQGRTVLFTWDEQHQEYRVEPDEGEAIDERLLEGLHMGMDLSGLLPDGPVEEGDTWVIDLARLQVLGMPGGNLRLMPDGGVDDLEGFDPELLVEMIAETQERALERLGEWVDGEVEATFVGVRTVDDRELAVIDLTVDLTVDAEVSDLVQRMLEQVLSAVDAPLDVDLSVDLVQVDAEIRGEGQLLWDPAAAHGHSFELTVEYDVQVELEVSAGIEGEEHEFSARCGVPGSGRIDVAME